MSTEEEKPEENMIPTADMLTVPPEASWYGNCGVQYISYRSIFSVYI
jgi:hypothetical protein